jgi:cation:H+ antiporter
MTVQAALMALAALFGLFIGARALVSGGAGLAFRLGVNPLVVGLTVVAFGTSTPELFVVVSAALEGAPGVSVGNVVGANNLNLGLILGGTALLRPLQVHSRLVRFDVPVVAAASLLLALMLIGRTVSRLDGAILLACLVAYAAFNLRLARKGQAADMKLDRGRSRWSVWLDLGMIFGGVAVLSGAAQLLVSAAVEIATRLDVSQALIGMTVVALGTTLPELVTSLVAVSRGSADIAVGNIVGSNVFNVFGVLGLACTLRPLDVPDVGPYEVGSLLVMASVAYLVMGRGMRVSRAEGAVLVASYFATLAVALLL